MLLTEFSESFKLAAHTQDPGSTSSTQASAAQPESSHKLKTTKQGRKPLKIDVDASIAGVDHVGENLIDVSPLIDFDDFEFVYDFDTEAVGSSKSEEGQAEPRLSKLMKLTEEDDEYDESLYKANQQSLSDLLLELPAPSNESPAKRNISPPLEHALARRASILSYKAPGASSLRNEAHGQVKGPVADADPLIPPIFLFKEASGSPKVKWHIPPEIEETLELEFRPSGTGLFAHEWVKVPIEFRHHSENNLARFWDLTYNSVVRKTVLLYKHKLATAGKADQVLDWPNRLLAALVDIQEFDIREGAEHVFDTSDTKTSKHKLSISAIPEESAGCSGNNILIAALREVNLSLADPNRDTFTAQEKLALSEGVKLDSQNAPILTEVLTDFYKELPALRYSSKMATTLNDREKIISEKLALLELQAFGIGKGEESELAMEDATTGKGKGKGKEGDRLVEGSVSGKGKDRENELPLEDAKTGKGKAKESDMLVKDPAIGEGIGKENGSPVKDTTIGKGKGKNKGKGKSKSKRKGKGKGEGEGEGEKGELLVEGPAIDKGKGKEGDHYEATMRAIQCEILAGAKALFLDPKSEGFLEAMSLNLPLTQKQEVALVRYKKTYDFMEGFIRPQIASLALVEFVCKLLLVPDCFAALTPIIEELRWNREIVQHPSNPMITSILQCTQRLRPTDGLHHSSGISVAPLLVPRYPPLPPGPAPATPVVTTPTKEQSKKDRTGFTKSQHAPIKAKVPFDDQLRALDQREAIIVAQIKAGVPLSAAQVHADFMEIGQSRLYVQEKVRLEVAGGKWADRLAGRQKKMGEKDEAPDWWLLP